MKNILPLAFMLLILCTGCETKKKQYIPLQTIVQEDATKSTAVRSGTTEIPTSNSATSSTTTTSGSTTAPNGSTETTGSNSSNGSTTTANGSTETTGSNSLTGSTSTTSGSTETSGSNSSTGSTTTTGSNTTTLNQVQPGATVTVSPTNNTNFTYQTTTTIPVNMVVTDDKGTPISPATVTITNPEDNNVLLQQVTGTGGTIIGSITVPSTTTHVDVTVSAGGSTSQSVEVPLQVPVTTNGTTTNQTISSIGNITLPISNPNGSGTQIADRDQDGIDDEHDFYPDDPNKATKIRFPATGVNTIAFEDLYPKAGDADLNDYVIQFYNEEDLNAQGQIVEVRGAYQHVAKGAGYTHTLNLLLPNTVNVSFESTVTDGAGVIKNTGIAKYNPTSTQLDAGLSILANSGTTITSPNAKLNQTYSAGHVAKVKIIFNTPVERSVIGSAPYNIYIYVNNTKKKIFFPGKYFDTDGKDLYMDTNGFPWAIMVPGIWAWPLEGQDIRNPDVTGYPRFNAWATSKGVTDKDWYTTVTTGKVYPLPSEPSNLLAYLKGTDLHTNAFMAVALIAFGVFMGLVFRKKLTTV